jgi:hypothetical protein
MNITNKNIYMNNRILDTTIHKINIYNFYTDMKVIVNNTTNISVCLKCCNIGRTNLNTWIEYIWYTLACVWSACNIGRINLNTWIEYIDKQL